MTTNTAMVAHTPGPWHVDYVVDGAFQISAETRGDECVLAARAPFPARHDEFVANAHLIAAAPGLLDALRKVNDMACYASEENSDAREETLLLIGETVRAAIAKAEGAS